MQILIDDIYFYNFSRGLRQQIYLQSCYSRMQLSIQHFTLFKRTKNDEFKSSNISVKFFNLTFHVCMHKVMSH